MAQESDEYWLTTTSHASARHARAFSLNLQHFWSQLSCGYLIHPDIPVGPDCRILDIGTGTGIWPVSLATTLPPTVQLDGLDITDAQYPPKEWLPANVTLSTWDAYSTVPKELAGTYDIVNIRYMALTARENNLPVLLRNLLELLRPGGYLQWVEVNIPEQEIVSASADAPTEQTSRFSENGKNAIATLGVDFKWLQDLPSTLSTLGLANTRQFKPPPVPALRSMSSYLAIGGWEEFSYAVLDKRGPHPLLGSGQDLRRSIQQVRREIQAGAAIEQFHYVTIGQKSV